MSSRSPSPFSARNRPDRDWIEEEFPPSARNGLLHVLNEAIERSYLRSWAAVAKELGRIARVAPVEYNGRSVEGLRQARVDVEQQLNRIAWDRAYDFCERLYSHLTGDLPGWLNDAEIVITKGEAQSFLLEEVQRLFEEENLGYEFRDGLVQRRGKRHTINQTNKAQKVMADQKLIAARIHFAKALRYFHDRKSIDHENAVKEAVCAVEAAAKGLFPDAKANTLGDFIGWATNSERGLLPKTIGLTFSGLYGFRNSGEGVAHGAATGGAVTAELSEYVLGVAASQIVFLADLMKDDEEIPF
jgi:hypothetical protein